MSEQRLVFLLSLLFAAAGLGLLVLILLKLLLPVVIAIDGALG
jgi:hypothetical protein